MPTDKESDPEPELFDQEPEKEIGPDKQSKSPGFDKFIQSAMRGMRKAAIEAAKEQAERERKRLANAKPLTPYLQ